MIRSSSLALLSALLVAACAPQDSANSVPDDYLEWDIAAFQEAMESGELTARALVDYHLERIEGLDRNGPQINSIIEVNPDARRIADALDSERASQGPRGPLHGIPVVLKANIDTGDRMATTAGSLALEGHVAPDDAFLVQQLRDAGAVILGKANLSEWANFRSTRSSSGWSSLGGQTRNPYDPARNPCGSSSGSGAAVAANLAVLAVGTETDGSIVCPASINGIVGIKPTLGLVSRDGIIPIAHSQDTAGPMGRSVRDAALMLNAMVAADPDDPASADRPDSLPDYASDLSPDALQGKRIGVLRNFGGAGENPYVEQTFSAAIETLRELGAVIVDDLEPDTDGLGDAEYEVLLYEFKADLADYFASADAPLRSLADIIEFNEANAEAVMPFFGQEHMLLAVEKGGLDDEAYREALAASKRIARAAVDDTLATHELDALIAPSNGPSWMTDHVTGDHYGIGSSSLAAVSGYANVTVPAGYAFELPLGLSFIGGAFSEHSLIRMAYAFERATMARQPPDFESDDP
ncbi:MAG: amidase [Woeseiaceae bacterium]|nr:amidase [Woeseiaceae bacterium]